MLPKSVVIVIIFSISSVYAQISLRDFFDNADQFLEEYVVAGSVKYESIFANPGKLKELLHFIESTNLIDITDTTTLKTYLINAYNILVINSVVEHYPLESPLSVSGFFESIKHKLGHENLTLNEIEKEKLFDIEIDPRFHFAVVCAAIGCPELVPYAYRPQVLDEQLNQRAKDVLNSSKYVHVDKVTATVQLNEIFDWYYNDFIQLHDNLVEYINEYRNEKIPANYSIEFIKYDWRLNDFSVSSPAGTKNLQSFTPSVLIEQGQYEAKIFNNLYTQTGFFDNNSEKQDQNSRSTFFTSLVSFLYGVSTDINVGFEFWFRSVRNDSEDSSPFALFKFESAPTGRTEITRIGPKIKLALFNSGILKNFSIQSTFLFAIGTGLSGVNTSSGVFEPYIDDDAHIWLTQFFYDKTLNDDISFFGEIDTWFRIDRDFEGRQNQLDIPLKLFLSYYPTSKITLYATHEFNYKWFGDNTAFYNQAGIGSKYQITPKLELEALITIFYAGRSSGAGSTYNLGFRYLSL